MKVVFPILLIGIVLIALLMSKKPLKNGLEFISIYWFRFAFSFLVLYLLNVGAGFLGIYVPINIASGLVITVLGIPGLASICALAIFF